jgi:hypothetical protein
VKTNLIYLDNSVKTRYVSKKVKITINWTIRNLLISGSEMWKLPE